MIFPKGILILIAVSLALCSIGFKRFVWFLSVGYGLSAAGIAAALLVMALVKGEYTVIYLVQCALMLVYGIRLGGFLLMRELKNESYRKKLAEVGGDTKVPVFAAFFIWVILGLLYVAQSAAPIYRLLNGFASEAGVVSYVGTGILALGILMEALADKQKSKEKESNPDMPAMHGLYKLCRCPNYFGEMLFWTGVFITGFGALQGAGQWIVACFGYVAIIFIMMSGAKRVETRHIKHYGNKPEYVAYADKTPLIIPFIPLYHMTSPEKIAAAAAKKAK